MFSAFAVWFFGTLAAAWLGFAFNRLGQGARPIGHAIQLGTGISALGFVAAAVLVTLGV